MSLWCKKNKQKKENIGLGLRTSFDWDITAHHNTFTTFRNTLKPLSSAENKKPSIK